MAFTNNQLDSFWTNGLQMNLQNPQRLRLSGQGLTTITDIGAFNDDMLQDACENLKLKVDAPPLVIDPATNNVFQNFVSGIPATHSLRSRKDTSNRRTVLTTTTLILVVMLPLST